MVSDAETDWNAGVLACNADSSGVMKLGICWIEQLQCTPAFFKRLQARAPAFPALPLQKIVVPKLKNEQRPELFVVTGDAFFVFGD